MQKNPTTVEPIVTVERVSKRFAAPGGGEIQALKSVSLSLPAGKFTTLLGPSGCGKTTLLRAIAGFDDPDGGCILIDGRDVTHYAPFDRPVNTVFQQYALFPHLTIAQNVAYGLEVAGVARSEISQRVDEALKLVRLDSYGTRRITQISGGQQQRVALARSLVLRPKVLLLDEPLAALDRNLRKEMQIELKRLQHDVGIAFLCVTHDQEEALSMSDVVVVMNRGEIEQIGTPYEVYNHPSTRFVAGFVGEASMLSCRAGAQAPNGLGTVLHLAGGETLITAERNLPDGELTAVVRPERLLLRHSAEVNDGSSIAGTVVNAVYLGEKTRLQIKVGANDHMLLLLDGALAMPTPGAHIVVSYAPTDIRVVAR